jgi:hypothetical protein
MRFAFLDSDPKLLLAAAYDGEWDAYIDDFVTKIPDDMDTIFPAIEGFPGIRSSQSGIAPDGALVERSIDAP